MAELKGGRSSTAQDRSGNEICRLKIRNRSRSRLNLVLHGTEASVFRAMTVRFSRRMKLIKGTYVMEAWLNEGRITIHAVNIPYISIERITNRKDVSIRGRRIVADFINDKARLEFNREPSAADIVQNI